MPHSFIVSGTNPERTLLLVDGSSYLYRAFHALPELKSPQGEPTGAIYGVLNMLRRLAADYEAQARAVVFDAKGRTFRDDQYPEYKAHRAPMPDELSAQVEPLSEAIRALGWPVLVVEGVEADDVIATLADEATRRGWRSVISTGDKDLAQLVDSRVTLVNTMSNETLDIEGVKLKFGVPPEKIVDYLTLVGDAIDNIPGVDKVGPKTAARWLSQYGSLEGVIAHAGEITGSVGENLRKVLDWLPKGRGLITVKRDVALPVTLDQLADRQADPSRQRALYERFGFRTWLKEVESAPQQPQQPSPPSTLQKRRYSAILTEGQLRELVKKLETAPLVGFDTECVGLEPMTARLVGMSFAFGNEAVYLPLAHEYPAAPQQIDFGTALELLKPWLEGAGFRKVGQNFKFDCHVLANQGLRLAGCVHDTLLESYVLEVHQRHDLGALALRHCGWQTISYDEVTGKGATRIEFSAVEIGRATEYAAEDADCTLALHEILHPRIEQDKKLQFVYEEIEMRVLPVLFRMERNGVLLDAAKLEAQSHELGKEMLAIEQKAYEAAGQPFNLGSPKQIQEILFERQKLPVRKKTPSGQPSTDEDVLAELALEHPLPKRILEYRALSKLKSTYTDKLPKSVDARTGRVHTTYSQTTAVTGRLASNEPNLQNIPHAGRAPHPRGVHRAGGREDRVGRLFADRAAHHGAPLRRREPEARVRARRRRAPRHGRGGIRPAARQGHRRRAAHRKGDQLRAHLRHVELRPGAEPRHRARDGASLYRVVFRPLSGGEALYGPDAQPRPHAGLRRNGVRPAPLAAGDEERQPHAPPGGRARRDQRTDAGHRRRLDQAGDGCSSEFPRAAKTAHAADHAGA